jgi:hypothetical protein
MPKTLSAAEKANRERVQAILAPYLHKNTRIRIFLGYPETGYDWGEENDVSGYIGRSTGSEPVFLLLPTRRSMGGGAISTDCALRILADGREIYRHPKYKEPVYELREGNIQSPIGPLPYEVWRLNAQDMQHKPKGPENVANFKTAAQRQRWLDFMHGKRATK